MITRNYFLGFFCSLFILASCADSQKGNSESTSYIAEKPEAETSPLQAQPNDTKTDDVNASPTQPNLYVSSQAATGNTNTADRKFIRTAEMRMRVKNVYQYSLQTEDAIARLGGFITYSQLQNTHDYTQTLPFSKDSIMEITYYTVSNQITARVPVALLDSTLRLLATQAEYIDYRTIRAEDVTLRQKANELTIERAKTSKNTWQEEDRDQAKIDNIRLEDDIKWSTINIWLYQRQTFIKQVVFNPEQNQSFEPSFGQKLLNALSDSFKIVEELILFLVRIWFLILIIILVYIGYKTFKNRKNTISGKN